MFFSLTNVKINLLNITHIHIHLNYHYYLNLQLLEAPICELYKRLLYP